MMRQAMCSDLLPLNSVMAALDQLLVLKKRNARGYRTFRVFKCANCWFWHVMPRRYPEPLPTFDKLVHPRPEVSVVW